MEGVKSLFESRTFWGAVIAVLSALAGFIGYTVAAEDQAALIEHVSTITGVIGGLIAIWGRIKATKMIGTPPA